MKKIMVISICFFLLSWLPQPIQHENSSLFSTAYLDFCHKYNIGPARADAFVFTGLIAGGAISASAAAAVVASAAVVGGAVYYTVQVANDPNNPFNTRNIWQILTNFKLDGTPVNDAVSVPDYDSNSLIAEISSNGAPDYLKAPNGSYYRHVSTESHSASSVLNRDGNIYPGSFDWGDFSFIFLVPSDGNLAWRGYRYEKLSWQPSDCYDMALGQQTKIDATASQVEDLLSNGANITADATPSTVNKPADANEDNTVQGPTIAGMNENGEYVDEEGKVIPAEQLPQSVKDGQYDDILPVMPSTGVADIEAKTEDGGAVPLPKAIEALLKQAGITAASTITAVDGKTVYWVDAQGNAKRTVVSDALAQELASSGTVAQDVPGTEPAETDTPDYDIDLGESIPAAPTFDPSIDTPEKLPMSGFMDTLFNAIPFDWLDNCDLQMNGATPVFSINADIGSGDYAVNKDLSFDFSRFEDQFNAMGALLLAISAILAYKKALFD